MDETIGREGCKGGGTEGEMQCVLEYRNPSERNGRRILFWMLVVCGTVGGLGIVFVLLSLKFGTNLFGDSKGPPSNGWDELFLPGVGLLAASSLMFLFAGMVVVLEIIAAWLSSGDGRGSPGENTGLKLK